MEWWEYILIGLIIVGGLFGVGIISFKRNRKSMTIGISGCGPAGAGGRSRKKEDTADE